MALNCDHLLERAKDGEKLSLVELQNVRRALEDGEPAADPYTLLHILGKAEDRTATDLVRRFADYGLDDPLDDGMLRRLALQILTQWWTENDALPLVAERAFNDPSPLVRMVAARGIGSIGRKWPETRGECARLLLQGFERGRDEEEPEIWEAFYEGMMELCEVPPSARPYREGGLRPEDVDRTVVQQVIALQHDH